MKEPLLSVCLITYNHEKYIRQAIEGVLMQKVDFEWELIIADDCSTDGTRDILLEYKSIYPDFIKLILQEKNIGAAKNWYDLISSPKSKYIAYFEGDDYWIDNLKLQKQVDFLEANEDYGLVHTNNKVFVQNKMGFSTLSRDVIDNEELFEYLIFKSNPICTLTVCFRSELIFEYFNSLKFPADLYLLSDYPTWLWISLKSKIKLLNEVTGVYRILDESASQSVDPGRKVVFVENVRKQALFFLEKEREDEYKLAFYRKYALLYSRYVEKEHKKSIMQLFLKKKKYLDFVRFVLLGFLSPSNPAIKVIDKFHVIYNC